MHRRGFLCLLAATTSALADKSAGSCRVTAWTTNGQPIDPDGLEAQVEGRRVKTLRVRGPRDDLILLLVLDMTSDLARIEPARQSLATAIDALPPYVWTGALRAQDGLRVLVDPTPQRQPVIDAINGAQIAGRAGLIETIEPAAHIATHVISKTPVRVAVLFVTDSNIYNYRQDYTNPVINPSDSRDLSRRFPEGLIREKTSKLAASLAGADAPVFIVHLAFLRDRLNEAYQNGLQAMAQATGGFAAFCRTPADIPGEIHAAVQRILSHWAIDIEVPESVPRNFTVQLSAPEVTLEHRTRFARSK